MSRATPAIVTALETVPRTRVLLTAARPTGRALGLTPGPALAAASGVPVLWTLARGGTDLSVAVIATALVGASALAGAVEDAATTTTAAAPTTRLRGRLLRLAILAAGVALIWFTCFLGATIADVPINDPGHLLAVCLATGGLSVAVASWMANDVERGAGAGGSLAGVLIVLTSTAMNQQMPAFPTLMDLDSGRAKWWAVTAAAWAAAAWLNRDPAARTPWSRVLRRNRRPARQAVKRPRPEARGSAARPGGTLP